MHPFSQKSAVVQLMDHLREQILNGAISENMPGINQLVRELGHGAGSGGWCFGKKNPQPTPANG